MDAPKIQREIASLKKKVLQLSREVDSLKGLLRNDGNPVERMLRMRGLRIFRENPTDQLFFPAELPSSRKDLFYQSMKKYSFRLLLRDIIKHQERFRVRDLTRYCSPSVARHYTDLLVRLGMIVELHGHGPRHPSSRPSGATSPDKPRDRPSHAGAFIHWQSPWLSAAGVKLSARKAGHPADSSMRSGKGAYRTAVLPLPSFGPTLEWFVAEMFKREFASSALYRVKLKGVASGGDYDVVASWNRRLVYVETKSSPPRGVEQAEVSTFFDRMEALQPEVAIFFNDTQLRMKDKLVVMFEEELERRFRRGSEPARAVERLVAELFHVENRIFIVNSKRDAVENFSLCLNHYLRYGENDKLSGLRIG